MFTEKIKELDFKLEKNHLPPSESLAKEFEQEFDLDLPEDYRYFLTCYAGFEGAANCDFHEPTPMGKSTIIDSFYGFGKDGRHSITFNTNLIDGAPYVIAIGDNMMGAMFWLKCLGKDRGCVYMHDPQMRSSWPDQQFKKMFPNLSPEIKDYLKQRENGTLPEKSEGYEHVYLFGKNFTEFFMNLEKEEWD